MSNRPDSGSFIITQEHRRFVDFCDACRQYRYIGLCYGPPGVGKTLSARTYAHWDRIEDLSALLLGALPVAPDILACRTVLYTPPVANTPHTIRRQVRILRRDLSTLVQAMQSRIVGEKDGHPFFEWPDITELLLVDEADRLKTAGLEQLRDIYDRSQIGLVLIGMPGIEKRLSRYPQLYSRVGFVHHFKPLSPEEIHLVLAYKWRELDLQLDLSNDTDAEAMAAVIRLTAGNFRLIQRLFTQIERIMAINQLRIVTKEVVESARQLLVIGPA